MANDMCTRRLQRELQALMKNPINDPTIVAVPNEANILEWHYVIEGNKGTPYEGGHYHGKLVFPKEYPLKPPSVIMLTPSGRFKTGRRLCLSMSDFHPETWNPMWSVSTILTGLYSFMIESAPTLGSIETTEVQKRRLARVSLEYNCRDSTFCKLFPELLELHQRRQEERRKQEASSGEGLGLLAPPLASSGTRMMDGLQGRERQMQGIFAAAAGVVALLSIFAAMRFV